MKKYILYVTRNRKRFIACIAIIAFLLLYWHPYYVLSRNGMRFSNRFNVQGYYFVMPDNDDAMEVHCKLCTFYYPFIEIEALFQSHHRPVEFNLLELLRLHSRRGAADG